MFGQPLEQAAAGVKRGEGLAVFAGGILLRGDDLAAQLRRDELAAVADAQDRHAQREHTLVGMGRTGGVDAVRPAGENDSDGVKSAYLLKAHAVGLYLTVNAALADTAGDELVILPAEIKDQNLLIVHKNLHVKSG